MSDQAITTVEGALEAVARKFASKNFAEHVRRNLASGMDLSFVVTVRHVKDKAAAEHAMAVTVHYRRKTPASPLLVLTNLV